MVWQCRMVEYTKESSGNSMKIGDMFYGPTKEEYEADEAKPADEQIGLYWPYHFSKEKVLADYYKQNNSHRRPLLVMLPGHILFCVDGACWNTIDGKIVYSGGWTVTGEAPNITVSPSINCVGSYHGYLQNGVITDDCEGRKFDEDGRQIR